MSFGPVPFWSVRGVAGRSHGQAALQRGALARSSVTLCRAAWGARVQQSLLPWFVNLFCGAVVCQLTHSSGEWNFMLSISPLSHDFYNVALRCKYFTETKTIWKYLNRTVATLQSYAPSTVHGYFRGAALRQLGLCIGPCQLIFLRLSMASSMHLFGNSFFCIRTC